MLLLSIKTMKTANYVLLFVITNTIMCMAENNSDDQLTMEDFDGYRKNNENAFDAKIIGNQHSNC